MSTGSLIFPPGYTPLYQGSPVASGKLRFRRSGTSTAQDVYAESTLTTPLSNPLSLDANGMLDELVYFDPSSGYDYRIELLTSADAVLWLLDDVKVPGAATATISEGSFTGTLTGMTGATTGTVYYIILANAAGTGKICRLYTTAAITGTSNTTALTMTGIPAACTPSVEVNVSTNVLDSGAGVQAGAVIAADATTMTFYCDTPLSATGFTNSGTKGLPAGFGVEYSL